MAGGFRLRKNMDDDGMTAPMTPFTSTAWNEQLYFGKILSSTIALAFGSI